MMKATSTRSRKPTPKPISGSIKQMLRPLITMLLIPPLLSACASLGGITGIEAPALPASVTTPARPQRLSLCEIVKREELLYSRSDTEGTKTQLDRVIIKYDSVCGAA